MTLVRRLDDDAIFRADAADAGKVVLNKTSWFVPHVLPADAKKFSLYESIESKVALLLHIGRDNVILLQYLKPRYSPGD